jgi:hypothetical protein
MRVTKHQDARDPEQTKEQKNDNSAKWVSATTSGQLAAFDVTDMYHQKPDYRKFAE